MLHLRSLLFNLLYVGLTLLLAVLLLPALFLPSAVTRFIAWCWTGLILWLLRVICNIRVEVRGAEHILPAPAIYASAHQSAWETLFLWHHLDKPAFILKRELVWIPFFGLYLMRVGNIWINRKAGQKALKSMLASASERVRRGCSIIIFPHGTRLKPGTSGRMHSGVAAIYAHTKLPVIPVALNSGLYWGKRAFIKKPGTIIIQFLPPIAPGLSTAELMAQLKTKIENASANLMFD